MTPADHVDWFEDNIAFFEAIDPDHLERPIPACAGWTVETVLNHLSRGLGIAYAHAVGLAPDTDPAKAFADLDWPESEPTGRAALDDFSRNLSRCLATFRSTPPSQACFTYAGPGQAAFWFLRAAVETAVHRFDVEAALEGHYRPIPPARAVAGIVETIEFAFPMAIGIVGEPAGQLVVHLPGDARSQWIGTGALVEVSGDPTAVLATLWGRRAEGIVIADRDGNARGWLSLVERAFARG